MLPTKTLDALLHELRAAIAKSPESGGDRTRYFARHELGMRGEEFKRVREWFRDPSCMRDEEIQCVRHTLVRLATRTQKLTVVQGQKSSDRRLISHAVAVLSSLKSIVADINLTAVNDGDRMYVRSAVDEICKRFGIRATFIDPADSKSHPATRSDLTGVGLKRNR